MTVAPAHPGLSRDAGNPVPDAGRSVRTGVRLGPRTKPQQAARSLVRWACRNASTPRPVADRAVFVAGQLADGAARATPVPLLVVVEADLHVVTLRVRDERPQACTAADSPESSPMQTFEHWDAVRRVATTWGYSSSAKGREVWVAVRACDSRTRPGDVAER